MSVTVPSDISGDMIEYLREQASGAGLWGKDQPSAENLVL